MTDKCRSCGAKIIWIKDQDGTCLPINAHRVRVYDSAPTGWHYKEVLRTTDPLLYYISHFLTCPDSTKHSKRNADRPNTVD